MRFIKKIILSFCMISVLLGSMPLCVYANDLNDGENDGYDRFMGGHNIEGFNTWEATDKKSFTLANIGSFFASIGMYFKGMSNENLMDILIDHLIESGRIEDAESTDEYIASHLTANEEETELYLSSDFTNALYETSVQYIEEETGWYIYYTYKPSQVLKSLSYQAQYETLCNLCEDMASDEVMLFNLAKSYNGSYYPCFQIMKSDGFISSGNQWVGYYKAHSYYKWARSCEYTVKAGYILNDGSIEYASDDELYNSDGTFKNFLYGASYSFVTNDFTVQPNSSNYFLHMRSTHTPYRIYKTMDDYKAYSVGERPYYVTETFTNYDSAIDNSTTITQTEIDNSVTYGDVYNYITNNYENPDGLSEDELCAILAEYLSSINNSGGSGSGSGGGSGGSDDGGSSGGGLGSFLEGLGSIGDAILSILGKLLEYIGKALELLTGTVTKVLDLIPSNVTNLLLGLFPFIPQEWVTAIELSLVLGVVLAVVGAFKK